MRFARFGKTYQLRIETATDLEQVLDLDESLWMATGAPVKAFRCDPALLSWLDQDGDGRILTDDLRQAIKWLLDNLSDTSHLSEGTDTIPLSAIRSDSPEGQALVQSARYILANDGGAETDTVSLNQVRTFRENVRSQPLNGDGVIVPGAAEDPKLAQFIQEVLACRGAKEDASGREGIDLELLQQFMTAVTGYLEWQEKSKLSAGTSKTPLMPLGEDTPNGFNIFRKYAEKVDLFFMQSEAVRFEPRVREQLSWPSEAQGAEQALQSLRSLLERAPLAHPTEDGALPLSPELINPLYRDWIAALKEHVLAPIFGRVPEELSQEQWFEVKSSLAPYEAHLQEKQGTEVKALPLEKLKAYRDGDFEAKARELIEADQKVASIMENVRKLEKLLLYHQHLMRLANNFVSFPELYAPEARALFEIGSAVLDGRWFNFAVRVENRAAHSAVAKMSNIFTIYLESTEANTQETFCLAVPATWGTKGNIGVGKQGIFFDITGKEYGARVVEVIENPISVQEALVAPFVKLWGFLAGKIEALSAKVETGLQKGVDKTLTAVPQAAAKPTGAFGGAAGIIAAVGLAVAALSSAFAYIVSTLAKLEFYQVALGLLGAVLVVMVPVSVIALMKLKKQDLSALLEGCGWAINTPMRLSRAQRRHFTTRVPYPKGAEGTPGRRWGQIVVILVLVAALLVGAYYGARALWRRQPKAGTPASVSAEDVTAVQTDTFSEELPSPDAEQPAPDQAP